MLIAALAASAAAIWTGTAVPAVQIVGGAVTQIQSSPSTVVVQYEDTPGSYRDCTGVIIDATHVVTAAVCLFAGSDTPAAPSALLVAAGVSNFFAPIATDAQQTSSVSSFRIFPTYVYGSTDFSDDVAVLTLTPPLALTGPAVQSTALPSPHTPAQGGEAVTIAAFGGESPGAAPSGLLESMTATLDPQAVCGDYTEGTLIADHNATARCFVSHSSTTCTGDSGAGVFTAGGTPTLIGIVVGPTSGLCQTGGQNTFIYLAAPEILSFIQGSDSPPVAPRRTSSTKVNLDWSSPIVVGAKITCSTSDWKVAVHVSYSFQNAANGKVLQTGTSASYVVKPKDVGIEILCQARVVSSGGTLLVSPLSTGTVQRK